MASFTESLPRGLTLRVVAFDPVAVFAALDIGDPLVVGEIPGDGLGDAGFEGFQRTPAELALDLAGIDGVALVMAGTIGDVVFQLGILAAAGAGALLVEQGAERVYDFEVGLFVAAADAVGFAWRAALIDEAQGARVIVHIEPVADVVALAVDRQRLAGAGVEDHHRDQLFRELVGAVVVRAVGDQRG